MIKAYQTHSYIDDKVRNWNTLMLVEDADDGECLMMSSEVICTNPDLERECFSFHVRDKWRHHSILRIYSFFSL